MNNTVLELNAQEIQSFMAWREHQDTFEKLQELGVFGVRNGSVELHFDTEGNLSSALLHFKVFQRHVGSMAVGLTTKPRKGKII